MGRNWSSNFRTSLNTQQINVMRISFLNSSGGEAAVFVVLFTLPRKKERLHFLTFLTVKLSHMTEFWSMNCGL